MLDLLNASIPYRTAYLLIVVLGILLIIEVLVFAILLLRSRINSSKERELIGLTLDTAIVKREFTVGDEFDCDGLVVQANYSPEPISVNIVDYVVLTEEELNQVKSQGDVNGCYVVKPNMNEAGKKMITVLYLDKTSAYSIAINEISEERLVESVAEPTAASVSEPAIESEVVQKAPQTIFVAEDSAEGRMRYNKSFTARFIQSDEQTKLWYNDIKNELLSYKKVKDRLSWQRETFRWHKDPVARLAYRGKTLCVFLPLNVSDYIDKYNVEDASDTAKYIDTPLMIRLKNNRRVKIALLLIGEVMKQKGVAMTEHQSVDYYMPYEGTEELIKKGLIKL